MENKEVKMIYLNQKVMSMITFLQNYQVKVKVDHLLRSVKDLLDHLKGQKLLRNQNLYQCQMKKQITINMAKPDERRIKNSWCLGQK